MRNPWIIAQLAIAVVLLGISLIGFIGLSTLGLPLNLFSDVGGIQAVTVIPGLVLSLVVNALLMGLGRAPVPNLAQRVLLIIEFVLIAALLLFQFVTDPEGNFLGVAILSWPLLITIGVGIAVFALARRIGRAPVVPAA
jgi:hypothetical protein